MTGKVLVVDDDEYLRQFLCMTLRIEGYEVLEAANGDQALKVARAEKPNLILLDWIMPGQPGIEVLKTLRADESTKDIPVIMVTAKSEDADLSLSSLEGASAYLSKPFDATVVSLLVNRFMEGAQQ
ncbi:MAG TPA: response regulator [Abditibacteriaceae bacterium]|jgi:DNA-binding response OmpR family regulator